MSIWQLLKKLRMGLQKKHKKYHDVLGEFISFETTDLATQENRRKSDLYSQAINPPHSLQQDELYQNWIMLSPREQEVTALTCLKFTNPQIAAYLGLSKETVKTYIQNVLNKFGLRSKADLRVMFAPWDFSEWDRRKPHI